MFIQRRAVAVGAWKRVVPKVDAHVLLRLFTVDDEIVQVIEHQGGGSWVTCVRMLEERDLHSLGHDLRCPKGFTVLLVHHHDVSEYCHSEMPKRLQ